MSDEWLTPNEFEERAGSKAKNYLSSIMCMGRPLRVYGNMHAMKEEERMNDCSHDCPHTSDDCPPGMVRGPNGQLWPAWVFCTRYYNAEVHEVQYSDEED